jgi:hypothetical protein
VIPKSSEEWCEVDKFALGIEIIKIGCRKFRLTALDVSFREGVDGWLTGLNRFDQV